MRVKMSRPSSSVPNQCVAGAAAGVVEDPERMGEPRDERRSDCRDQQKPDDDREARHRQRIARARRSHG